MISISEPVIEGVGHFVVFPMPLCFGESQAQGSVLGGLQQAETQVVEFLPVNIQLVV